MSAVELLENRTLFAFATADLAGFSHFITDSNVGTVAIGNDGLITAGAFTDVYTGQVQNIDSGNLTINEASGATSIAFNRTDDGVTETSQVSATVSATKDVLIGSSVPGESAGRDDRGTLVIGTVASGVYSLSDLVGVWQLQRKSLRASIAIDAGGNISGTASLPDGQVRFSSGSSVTIDSETGALTFSLVGSDGDSISATGYLAAGRDTFSFIETTVDSDAESSRGLPGIGLKQSIGKSKSSLAGTYGIYSAGTVGTVTFDGKGSLTGSATEDEGTVTITGKYSVMTTGAISGTLTIVAPEGGSTRSFVGQISASGQIVILNDKKLADQDVSGDIEQVILVDAVPEPIPGPASVFISSDVTTVDEGQAVGLTVTRVSDASTSVTVSVKLSGSAKAGVDYSPVAGTVTLAAGETTGVLTIATLDDSLIEKSEVLIATLVKSKTTLLAGPSRVAVIVSDNEPTLSLTAIDASATRPASSETSPTDTATLRVSRSGSTGADLSLRFSLSGKAGSVFSLIDTSVVIPAGSDFVDLVLVPVAATGNARTTRVSASLLKSAAYSLNKSASKVLITVEPA